MVCHPKFTRYDLGFKLLLILSIGLFVTGSVWAYRTSPDTQVLIVDMDCRMSNKMSTKLSRKIWWGRRTIASLLFTILPMWSLHWEIRFCVAVFAVVVAASCFKLIWLTMYVAARKQL